MELEHEFTVPVPVEQAWPVLLDVERVAACMPGATLDSLDGDDFTGRMKVKVGPVTVTYRGRAGITDKDETTRTATIEASGNEARGSGTASATVKAQLRSEGGSTRVTVYTDLQVTGRPAQFGGNVMSEVGGKLIDTFADRLADQLSGALQESAAAEATDNLSERTTASGVTADTRPGLTVGTSASGPSSSGGDSLNLVDLAGGPVLKRSAPALGALLALLGIVVTIRRKSRRRAT